MKKKKILILIILILIAVSVYFIFFNKLDNNANSNNFRQMRKYDFWK